MLLCSVGSLLSVEPNQVGILPPKHVKSIELLQNSWYLDIHPNGAASLIYGAHVGDDAVIPKGVFDFEEVYHLLVQTTVKTQPQPLSPESTAAVTFWGGYDLSLRTVEALDALPETGRWLVIVALVGTDLHVRIFDPSGERVVDKPESELANDERLARLKQRLSPLPAEFSTMERAGTFEDVTAISGHSLQRQSTRAYTDDENTINDIFRLAIENAIPDTGVENPVQRFNEVLRRRPPTAALAGVRPKHNLATRRLHEKAFMEAFVRYVPNVGANQANPRPTSIQRKPRPTYQLQKSLETVPTVGPKPGTSIWTNTLLFALLAVMAIAVIATVLTLKARRQ